MHNDTSYSNSRGTSLTFQVVRLFPLNRFGLMTFRQPSGPVLNIALASINTQVRQIILGSSTCRIVSDPSQDGTGVADSL